MPNPVGRPPKFENPEQLQQMFDEWKTTFTQENDEIPDVEGLCVYLDCSRQTLFEYGSKPEYSDAIKRIKDWIHAKKKQLAFKGKIPPAIFIFDAINNTDYRNQTNVDHTTKGKELPTPILGGLTKDVPSNDSDKEAS